MLNLVQMKHMLVVDATVLSPSVSSPQLRLLMQSGLHGTLMELASCHKMRLQYSPTD